MLRIPANGGKAERILSSTDETKYFGGNSTVSKDGTIFFGIRKYIWMYTKKGPVKFSDQRLEWNQAMYIDEDGSIYVPDIGVGNGTVFRLHKDGSSVKIADNLISKLERPKDKHNDVLLGMGKDEAGNFYITELAGRRVAKIDPKGNVSTFYTADEGWKPTAVTFHKGDAFVHEYGRIGTGYDFRIVRIYSKRKQSVLVKLFQLYTPKECNRSDEWMELDLWRLILSESKYLEPYSMDHNQLVKITKRGRLSEEEFTKAENSLYEAIWRRLFPPQILTDGLFNTISKNVITDPAAPIPDCTTCGACCTAFVVVDAERASIPNSKLWTVTSVNENGEESAKRFLRRREPDFACAALEGEVGDEVSCSVYENRPSMCRKFEAGSDRCHAVRRAFGIEPFLTTDEMLEANRKIADA